MNKIFVLIWGGTVVILALFVAATNLIVDPYGLFRLLDIVGFNQQKEGVRTKIRFVKQLELPLRKPNTILMGSSRVHDAINPDSPALQGLGRVYNYGVDMNRIRETRMFLQHAVLNSDIKHAVIGLDFFMFNAQQPVNFDFDPSMVGVKVSPLRYLGSPLFSTDALVDSLKTLRGSVLNPSRREFLANGFRPQAFLGLKNYPNIHYYTNWTFLTPSPQKTKYYNGMSINEEAYDDFEAILHLCREEGIDLRLYISPAHASLDGEGIRATKLFDIYEAWKLRITITAEKYGVMLWDFSGYNSVTTESVVSPMRYYWDSSHFTQEVGDWVLARIFNSPLAKSIPKDFGVRLTADGINHHIKSTRYARDRYIDSLTPEAKAQLDEFTAIVNGAPLDIKRSTDIF